MLRNKKKLLIINFNQFGYDAGYFYYVKYLNPFFDVDYWCYNQNRKKIFFSGKEIMYFLAPKTRIGHLLIAFRLGFHLRKTSFNIVLYRNSKFAFIIKLISGKKGIYDVRTLPIVRNFFRRYLGILLIKFNTLFFNHVFVINNLIANELRFQGNRFSIVPLGAEHVVLKRNEKFFSKIKLLYVGTFNKRNIHETIIGLSSFASSNPNQKFYYDIVGSGNAGDENLIDKAIQLAPENLIVRKRGYITHDKLYKILFESSIGVSYIPQEKWFFAQPTTKIYEYLLAGLIVIATSTPSNIEVINDNNGVLIKDNPDSFCLGIKKIIDNIERYHPQKIAENSMVFHWKSIVENCMLPSINELIE